MESETKTQNSDKLNPEELEQQYRYNPKAFKNRFDQIAEKVKDQKLLEFWKIRLDFDKPDEIQLKSSNIRQINALIFVGILMLALVKIPEIFDFTAYKYFFYEKNVALIIFFGLSLYTFIERFTFTYKQWIYNALFFAVAAVYVNILPSDYNNQAIDLALIHFPLMLWCFFGMVYINFDLKDRLKPIDYIRFNGDVAIMSAVFLLAGALLTFLTIGLFEAISINIETFYLEYIVVWGLIASPVIASFIIQRNPAITNKIAPIIANIFGPLVLVTLIIFLFSIPIGTGDPYHDRDFLFIFNILLLSVMAIIAFSISDFSERTFSKFNMLVLLCLAFVTLIIDIIALSAIVYRLIEFGFTPNRFTVLVSNILILINLVLISIDLTKVNLGKSKLEKLEITIARYLPVYTIWTIIVVFIFPLVF